MGGRNNQIPEIIEDVASKELVPALDANMIAFWSAYGRANRRTLQAGSNVIWFYTGIPVPLFNGVLLSEDLGLSNGRDRNLKPGNLYRKLCTLTSRRI